MKELLTRSISGLLYVALLVLATFSPYGLTAVFFVFGIISLFEFSRLIQLKGIAPYIIFSILYLTFTNWSLIFKSPIVPKTLTIIAKISQCVNVSVSVKLAIK